jgi:hypothetical protein
MNAPSNPPPQVAYRKCVAESVVVEPFGPPPAPPQCFFLLEPPPPPPPLSALSMACCNGAGRKGKERKRSKEARLTSSSTLELLRLCVCVRAIWAASRNEIPKTGLIFSRLLYTYSQKGYLLCKLKVLKSSAFWDFLCKKKSKNNFAKKKLNKITDPKKSTGTW